MGKILKLSSVALLLILLPRRSSRQSAFMQPNESDNIDANPKPQSYKRAVNANIDDAIDVYDDIDL